MFSIGCIWDHVTTANVFLGSIFLESDLDLSWLRQSESFRASVDHWNGRETSPTNTRIDLDTQFSKREQYDAYQKICMEMKYK